MNKKTPPKKPKATSAKTSPYHHHDRIALMLQGGGALGAYQVGVYQALAEADCLPTWVCGVSIGAINGAIIAGNQPKVRLAKLEAFWKQITSRVPTTSYDLPNVFDFGLGNLSRTMGAWASMTTGAPGFFRPRQFNPWLSPGLGDHSTSLYDTSMLRDTLLEFVDFDLLNSGKVRLSVGAVNVQTGNSEYFDSEHIRIEPEHIMASGALGPAFPMVKIGDAHYWDGGIVSNTPLQYLLDMNDDISTLVFQVDLFNSHGELPKNMEQVLMRLKEIQYSSRTRQATSAFKKILSARHHLADALNRVPAKLRRPGEDELMHDYQDLGVINLIQLIYQGQAHETDTKDFEFSEWSMRKHQETGYADTVATFAHKAWFTPPTPEQGIVEYDIHRHEAS